MWCCGYNLPLGEWGYHGKKEVIQKFQAALLAVAPDYFAYTDPHEATTHGERVFAYELYHQMRLVFANSWYASGVFRKGLRMIPQLGRTDTLTPDLIVHESDQIEANLLAVEIKAGTGPRPLEVLRDMERLEFYTRPFGETHGGLNFQLGILLLINSCFSALLKRMGTKERTVFGELSSKAPRVAVWNIAEARPLDDGNWGDGRLYGKCLQIFRANDIKRMISELEGRQEPYLTGASLST